MLDQLRKQASLGALVVALIALFVAIGGVAGALPGKNTIDSGDIKKNAVKSPDIKNNNVTGTDVNESTLDLPSSSLPSVSFQSTGPIQYGKDGFGIVHLRGTVAPFSIGTPIGTLPAGFRPPATVIQPAVGGFSSPCAVEVGANGVVTPYGTPSCNNLVLDLSSVSFAAA
jgi:hypothetical protein